MLLYCKFFSCYSMTPDTGCQRAKRETAVISLTRDAMPMSFLGNSVEGQCKQTGE